jgi:hypothetical protein
VAAACPVPQLEAGAPALCFTPRPPDGAVVEGGAGWPRFALMAGLSRLVLDPGAGTGANLAHSRSARTPWLKAVAVPAAGEISP